ncbi:hypothetical protein [Thalassospira lohafexi]|uniref:General stress protein 17M-like domain-containing protein n=1 Tax=Thalassospira lohafexi TaxID=744227 RepID=A0A2N3L2T6_9PROT|nr:hypothetical protein [Thalassospira lohafexi]PKR57010.1 hypothetical protein COO92_18725 [Thalassospira lohafexi]
MTILNPRRETVGVFHDLSALQHATEDLGSAGFAQTDLSLLTTEHTIEDKLGHIYRKAEDIDNDPNMPPLAYTTPTPIGNAEGALVGAPMYAAAFGAAGAVIAAGGPIALTISAIIGASGVGAAAGGVIAAIIGKRYSTELQDALDQGGLLLWAKTPDEPTENRAKDILTRHQAELVGTHEVANSHTKRDML